METVLEARGLGRTTAVAVDGVDLSVRKGEKSDCSDQRRRKTTTLLMLLGVVAPMQAPVIWVSR
jgi:hypothetical protein